MMKTVATADATAAAAVMRVKAVVTLVVVKLVAVVVVTLVVVALGVVKVAAVVVAVKMRSQLWQQYK